jgi:hypothetical protein
MSLRSGGSWPVQCAELNRLLRLEKLAYPMQPLGIRRISIGLYHAGQGRYPAVIQPQTCLTVRYEQTAIADQQKAQLGITACSPGAMPQLSSSIAGFTL